MKNEELKNVDAANVEAIAKAKATADAKAKAKANAKANECVIGGGVGKGTKHTRSGGGNSKWNTATAATTMQSVFTMLNAKAKGEGYQRGDKVDYKINAHDTKALLDTLRTKNKTIDKLTYGAVNSFNNALANNVDKYGIVWKTDGNAKLVVTDEAGNALKATAKASKLQLQVNVW